MAQLKRFVLTEAYGEFVEYLETMAKSIHSNLEASRSIEDMYRLQGQLYVIRRLQKMKEDVLKNEK